MSPAPHMRYHLITIGNLKRTFYAEGCTFYLERLKSYAKVEVSELKEHKANQPEAVKQAESGALLRSASGFVIALDETGKIFNSATLAQRITTLENQSISHMSLLIGGAEGHSETLKKAANELWSLSPLTLPHELARLVLLEQLYRAETIRAGHPYHRA
ncbi:MAG: 23S rRNA (pseudouridine(1915)-N(3))-methyltransferase RlmH [Trueperaceae bacterium]